MNTDKLKLLKIGRQYKVKSFERLIKEYSTEEDTDMPNVVCGFNEIMKGLCGQKLTIDRPFDGHEGKLYHVKEASYCWIGSLEAMVFKRKGKV